MGDNSQKLAGKSGLKKAKSCVFLQNFIISVYKIDERTNQWEMSLDQFQPKEKVINLFLRA